MKILIKIFRKAQFILAIIYFNNLYNGLPNDKSFDLSLYCFCIYVILSFIQNRIEVNQLKKFTLRK